MTMPMTTGMRAAYTIPDSRLPIMKIASTAVKTGVVAPIACYWREFYLFEGPSLWSFSASVGACLLRDDGCLALTVPSALGLL